MTMLRNFPNVGPNVDSIEVSYQGGRDLASALSDEDRFILERDVFGTLGGEQGYLRKLFERNRVEVQAALAVAKFKIQATFRGISAGTSELGVRLIRAGDIMRTTGGTETPNNNWEFAFGTAGNNNFIGFGTSNGTAINIDKRILILVLGAMFTQGGSPVAEDFSWQIGGTTFPMEVIRHAWVSDNENRVRVAALRPKILSPKQTVYTQVRTSLVATNELVLVGLTFGLGSYLNLLAPSAVQT